MCKTELTIPITDEELEKAKKTRRLIKKAIPHHQRGYPQHVTTLFIDYNGKIRSELTSELEERKPFEQWLETFENQDE
ncbi:MAG: hypothetical protein ACFFDI_20605 [Promethearchaeota archaeon]